MNMFMEITIRNLWNIKPLKPEDYKKDGLWYCGKCGMPREKHFVDPSDKSEYNIPIDCRCIDEAFQEEQKEKELKKRAEIEHKRTLCFADSEMADWCFENDDGKSDNHAMQIARNYVNNFEKLRADGVGLFIHGDVGVGKSFMAACIVNALIDNEKACLMTDFTTVIDDLWKNDDRNAYRRNLNDTTLLVIDDLGREHDSKYTREIVSSILDVRCRSKRPMILTSNLSPDDLMKDAPTDLKRIYSRIFKLCIPVEFKGIDRRRVQMIQNTLKYHDILGL